MPEPSPSSSPRTSAGAESDLGELAALFSAHSGGSLPAEVSADLALEIVLNEIVEQACLATGATGAAVLLDRDGKMTCRASSGANAPELGARLDGATGLTAECIKTRRLQRCDDAQADPRADIEASRSLGVRSFMIFPLLRNDEIAGVLEVFSAQPGAFGERDELTLEALAQQILMNIERAEKPLRAGARLEAPTAKSIPAIEAQDWEKPTAEVATSASGTGADRGHLHVVNSYPHDSYQPDLNQHDSNQHDLNQHDSNLRASNPYLADLLKDDSYKENEAGMESEQNRQSGPNLATVGLTAAVLVCAVLLATLMGLRLGWHRGPEAPTGTTARDITSTVQDTQGAGDGVQGAVPSGVASGVPSAGDGKDGAVRAGKGNLRPEDAAPADGSLSVYENGKEIFHLPAARNGLAGSTEASMGTAASKVEAAAEVEPSEVIQLSPDKVAGSLLHRVEPDYPEEARQQGIQGSVVLDVHIGRDGAVEEANVVSGQNLLADAAIAAVKQWRFKTRMQQGRAVEMETRVTLRFRLPG